MDVAAMRRYEEIRDIAVYPNRPNELHTTNFPRLTHLQSLQELIFNQKNPNYRLTMERVRAAMSRIFAMKTLPPPEYRNNLC